MSFPFPRPFPGPSMVSFSVLSLFAAGEVGVWYDPSDFTTMFQDSAGTTPVTAVEQPVGLILDKSKGLAVGGELVTNGGFATDTDWTKGTGWTIASGVATRTATGAQSFLEETASVVNGSWYNVTFTVTALTAGDIGIRLGSNAIANHITATAIGTYTGTVQCGGTDGKIYMRASSGFAGSIDNVSVKLLAGNHASQSTAASRPVLSARVNLLTYTEQFDNAAWTKTGLLAFGSGSTANAIAAPDGTNTADKLVEDNVGGVSHGCSQASTFAAVSYTLSVYAKKAERNWLRLGYSAAPNDVWFDLNNGVVGTVSSGSTGAITNVGNGWYRCSITFTAIAGSYNALIRIANADNTLTYNGDGTSGIYIWGADLRPTNAGVNLPAYQRVVQGIPTTTNPAVTGTADYDTVGFPTYLRFDGVDDSLATGTISPGSVDKAQVIAGVRKLSDAAAGCIAELSASGGVNSGSFTLLGPSAAAADYFFRSRGTGTANGATATTFTSPITNVLSGLGDIAGDSMLLRANGAQVASNTVDDQGTGNFGSYPLYIGRRGGSTLPFNGQLYSLLVRFSATNLDAATISKTETWVNSMTKAY